MTALVPILAAPRNELSVVLTFSVSGGICDADTTSVRGNATQSKAGRS